MSRTRSNRDQMRNDRGSALVITMTITSLLTGLGCALVLVVDIETAIASSYSAAQEVRYTADGALECAMSELRSTPDWSVPSIVAAASGTASGCLDTGAAAHVPGAPPINLVELTAVLQADSDARYGGPASNPDAPRWQPFARGTFRVPWHTVTRPYVIAWVADDVDDGDGDPQRDSNGVVQVRTMALGFRSARAIVEASVQGEARGGGPAAVRAVGWREVR